MGSQGYRLWPVAQSLSTPRQGTMSMPTAAPSQIQSHMQCCVEQLVIPSVPMTTVFLSAPNSCDCSLLMWLLVSRLSRWNTTQQPELPQRSLRNA